MFKWRVISRSNINGKIHTFQKDFDDYEAYQEFVQQNPEYNTSRFLDTWTQPWSLWDNFFSSSRVPEISAPNTVYAPEGIYLAKYEKRLQEKRVERAEVQKKKASFEASREWLSRYLEENPDDQEAKDDLEKVKKEIEALA